MLSWVSPVSHSHKNHIVTGCGEVPQAHSKAGNDTGPKLTLLVSFSIEEICGKFVFQKISKPTGNQCLQEACRMYSPLLLAHGTMRKIMFHCGLLEIWGIWTLMEDSKEMINYCVISNTMVMSWVYSFFDKERIVADSSTGCVTIFLHHPKNQTLSVNQWWRAAHYHMGLDSPSYNSAPCTGIVCDNTEIVTVREDGQINLFRVITRKL